jgi:hypothetical protein
MASSSQQNANVAGVLFFGMEWDGRGNRIGMSFESLVTGRGSDGQNATGRARN